MTRHDPTPGLSALDVVDLPFVFTQRRALAGLDFSREADRRGLRIDEGRLEALHRAGILVPFLGIRYDAGAVAARASAEGDVDAGEVKAALDYTSTDGAHLLQERVVGDLFDPSVEPFAPWSESRSWRRYRYRRRAFLYSHYQLLRIDDLRHVRFSARRMTGGRLGWRVADQEAARWPPRGEERTRALAVVLSAIEMVYLPRVLLKESLPLGSEWEDVRAARARFDAPGTLARLGWSADQVRQQAERLVVLAHGIDPLERWSDLVRQIHPSQWDRLKGDALLAIDHRVAAELLFRFYEALVGAGVAQPLPEIHGRVWHPLRDRLVRDRSRLDAVLSRYELSPYPPVILGLEGETEMTLAPRVLELVVGARWRDVVELLDLEGIGQRLGHLAAFAVTPRLGARRGDVVELERPPTRLLLAVDAEGRYASVAKRRTERQSLVERMFRALPREYQKTEVRRQLAGMVHIVIWGRATASKSFEFAHFTPRELAVAIVATCASADVPDVDELARRITSIRGSGTPLKEVWKGWRPPIPRKPALAEELWPVLDGRIARAMTRSGYAPIPFMRIAERVARLASWPPRHGQSVVRLRRRRP
jgi:hypothetical protein